MHFLSLKRWNAAYEPRPDTMYWPGPLLSCHIHPPHAPRGLGELGRQLPTQDKALAGATTGHGPAHGQLTGWPSFLVGFP